MNPRGESRISIDGLAMPIDVKDGSWALSPLGLWLPQRSRPTCERFCERDICSTAGQFCQESLGVAVAVGPTPTGEQGKSLAGIALSHPRFAAILRFPGRGALAIDCAVLLIDVGLDATMDQW